MKLVNRSGSVSNLPHVRTRLRLGTPSGSTRGAAGTWCARNPQHGTGRDQRNVGQKVLELSPDEGVWFCSSLARSGCLQRRSCGSGRRLPALVGTQAAAFGHPLIWRREEAFVTAYTLVKDDQDFCCNAPRFLALPQSQSQCVLVFHFALTLLQFGFCKSAAGTRFAWIGFLRGLRCSTGGEHRV